MTGIKLFRGSSKKNSKTLVKLIAAKKKSLLQLFKLKRKYKFYQLIIGFIVKILIWFENVLSSATSSSSQQSSPATSARNSVNAAAHPPLTATASIDLADE